MLEQHFVWDGTELKQIEANSDKSCSTFKIDAEKLENWDGRIRCKDCGRWVWGSKAALGQKILHSTRCSSAAQPVGTFVPAKTSTSLEELKAAADRHLAGEAVDSDTVYDAYQAGYLSMSDAMNSDF